MTGLDILSEQLDCDDVVVLFDVPNKVASQGQIVWHAIKTRQTLISSVVLSEEAMALTTNENKMMV